MKNEDKKDRLIILDLDECLIHSIEKNEIGKMGYNFYKNSFDTLGGMYRTMLRPNLDTFLDYVFSNFNVAIWTASGIDYANDIVDKMKIDKSKLMFFYTEKNCTPKYEYGEGWGMGHMTYKKNISKLRKRGWDMSKVLMIDDKPEHIDSYSNVIKIKPFYGDPSDKELLDLIKYLDNIKDKPDFRKIEKRGWNKI
jgi:RNA polymerase II subunit A small phosphatase-like protein